MSWESTASYYKLINEAVKAELGGLHSAKIVLYSVDFAEIEKLQHEGKWGGRLRGLFPWRPSPWKTAVPIF